MENEPIPTPNRQPIEFGSVKSQFRFLKSSVFTVLDASITDVYQRKAVKELISQAFNHQLDYIDRVTLSPVEEQFLLDAVPSDGPTPNNI